MTKLNLDSILEEIKKNLGSKRMEDIMEDEPGTGDAGTTSAPKKQEPPKPAPIDRGAEARANIGDNSLGGGDTTEPATPQKPGAEIAPAGAQTPQQARIQPRSPEVQTKIDAASEKARQAAAEAPKGPKSFDVATGKFVAASPTGEKLPAVKPLVPGATPAPSGPGVVRPLQGATPAAGRSGTTPPRDTVGGRQYTGINAAGAPPTAPKINLPPVSDATKAAAARAAAAPAVTSTTGSTTDNSQKDAYAAIDSLKSRGKVVSTSGEPGYSGEAGKTLSQATAAPSAGAARPAPSMTMGPGGGLKPVGSSVGAPSPTAAPKPAAAPAPRAAAPAPRPAAAAPAPAAQPKSAQMFQASREADSGGESAASFFAAEKQRQREASAPSAPAPAARPAAPRPAMAPRPATSPLMGRNQSALNTRARPSSMVAENFEQFCKGFLVEQKGITPEKLRKQQSLKIDIGGEKHDPTSPNKSHIEEDVPITTPIGSNRRGKKKTSFAYTSLGGQALRSRASAHRQGNQKGQNRYESFELHEVRKVALKKVNEKKNEVALGSTDTGKRGETISTEPQKPELTGYH